MVDVDLFGLGWRMGICAIRPDQLVEIARVEASELEALLMEGTCSVALFEKIAGALELALEEERWLLKHTVASGDRVLRALAAEDALPAVVSLRRDGADGEFEVSNAESRAIAELVDDVLGGPPEIFGALAPSTPDGTPPGSSG